MNIIKLNNGTYTELRSVLWRLTPRVSSIALVKPVSEHLTKSQSIILKEQFNKTPELCHYEFISVLNRAVPDILFKMFMDNVFKYYLENNSLELLNVVASNFYPIEFNIRTTYIDQFMEIVDEYYFVDPIDRTEIENIFTYSIVDIVNIIFKEESNTLNTTILTIFNNFTQDLNVYLERQINAFYNYVFEVFNNSLILIVHGDMNGGRTQRHAVSFS